jgi:hypothetical protein
MGPSAINAVSSGL